MRPSCRHSVPADTEVTESFEKGVHGTRCGDNIETVSRSDARPDVRNLSGDETVSSGQGIDSLAIFEILMRESADSLLAFLRAAARDESVADDVFQETMLVAWRRLAEFDRARPFGAWLRGIAKRILMARRRLDARMATLPLEGFQDVLEHLDGRLRALDAREGDTFRERIDAISDCVTRLTEPHRAVLHGYYEEQLSTDQLAARLASTREAIQKRLQRARAAIADCLTRKGVFAPFGASP